MAASAPNSLNQRDKQRLATRERLYQAAVEEFRRVGCGQAQIDAIVRSAGVVRGTFYFHFPSKEHVLLEMQQRFASRFAAHLSAIRGTGASLERVLSQVSSGLSDISGAVGSHALMRDMLAVHVRSPLEEETAETMSPVAAEIVELFRELSSRGALRRDADPEQLALLLLSSLFGLMLSQTRPNPGLSPAPDFAFLMGVMQRGLGA